MDVDYFTKCTEAEALSEISTANIENFVWQNIVSMFGVPQKIVTDNGTQFESQRFKTFYEDLAITKSLSAVVQPQANEHVEAVNKIIKHTLKAKLERKKEAYADELPKVLWSYRTTTRSTTRETLFSMVYGTKAMISAESIASMHRRATFNSEQNEDLLAASLDLIEERRDAAHLKVVVYQ
ncbi:hypothetical protein ACOSP7_003327 [Xanthoceras sorbifolium]